MTNPCKKMKRRHVKIPRSHWLRGGAGYNTDTFSNGHGKYCAVGWVAKVLTGSAARAKRRLRQLLNHPGVIPYMDAAIYYNDNSRLRDEEREAQIVDNFAAVGVDVEFV